ncbi:antibiotic biosynthesis monooxygenase [Thalassospira sp. TSL5-1]|uniref:antibiotic biosynthesis monooxygenase family protein n=1 Tax=Thalassospira sp. TSL5-1 TaxID=1544451 RepID=UPI00093E9FB9|nr:antibiotic biosynthesis monooxygenase [Thalassospira sp. TSL5-1]OKH89857.1 polysaccharide biosynthesis protein [Thalassospira sp. TSL5-1]
MTLSRLPSPPYYAVIFASVRTDEDEEGYGITATEMSNLAAQQDGYLGQDSTARDDEGMGITVSYWRDEASILAWKKQLDHTAARNMGREKWYKSYTLRVARVERAYDFDRPEQA